jgi:hypothetical protein
MRSLDESEGEALLQSWKKRISYIHFEFEGHGREGQDESVSFEMAGSITEAFDGCFRLVGDKCVVEIEYG